MSPRHQKAAPLTALVSQATEFVRRSEQELLDGKVESQRMAWVYETYITEDTELLTAKMDAAAIAAALRIAKESRRYSKVSGPPVLKRKLELLRLTQTVMTPSNPAEGDELTRLLASMRSAYGRGKCRLSGREGLLDINALSRIMARSRDPDELRAAWVGWHAIARPMRPEFERFVELANRGAREVEFADMGQMWRSGYDMPPEAFVREVHRLWNQVAPFYQSLHAYVRAKLREQYGPEIFPPRAPIPAHLLGNMWSQTWSNIFPLVAPGDLPPVDDLTSVLEQHGIDATEMVRIAERFFVSLGFAPLPTTFWKRSQFTKPRDREVVCHPSAWDVDYDEDLRLKMCIDVTGEEFQVVHHELGHNFYQWEYRNQPYLFRDSAHDGFHEAVGDTVALSITPEYLRRIGLVEAAPAPAPDLGALLRLALDKVAFIPFGLMIDQWRWEVFAGKIDPQAYNRSWWQLRQELQGIQAPVRRTEEDFDPGAKMHVSANVPYVRYFLAAILQFQFHRALAEEAGHHGPLHRFSVYGNRKAGRRLIEMFRMGASRPWPEALSALTNSSAMDASALLEYFAPLREWLDDQTKSIPVGW